MCVLNYVELFVTFQLNGILEWLTCYVFDVNKYYDSSNNMSKTNRLSTLCTLVNSRMGLVPGC